MIRVLDLREAQPDPPPFYRGENKHGRVGRRAPTSPVIVRRPEDVDTLVIHQTACRYGPGVESRDHRRAVRIAAHAVTFQDQVTVLSNPFRWHVHHGNGYNPVSLGWEIEGRYSGRPDDPRTAPREDLLSTWGGPPDEVTPWIVAGALAGLHWIVEAARVEGIVLRKFRAHRQSSGTRRSDPGHGLWSALAPEAEALGLSLDLSEAIGTGRPIPVEWDRRATTRY